LVAGPAPPLLAAYLTHQAELKRFFLARTRSLSEADDLLQDLYLKVAAAPADDVIQQPLAYLYRLASNLMLDRIRGARRSAARDAEWRRTAHSPGVVEDLADEPPADQAVDARLRLQRVAVAISGLPPRVQEVFRLHKFEGLSHAEVAARLAISRSSVEKHMIAALRHLLETVGR
jgi:RNA polymerase sigma factor (sigma-70 family)